MHASDPAAADARAISSGPPQDGTVAEVRSFNRWFSTVLAGLNEHMSNTEYSVTEVRVLFALLNTGRASPSALSSQLRLDAGYLSRILRQFEEEGLLDRSRSRDDGRRQDLELTAKGFDRARMLDRRADEVMVEMLSVLEADERLELTEAMRTIRSILGRHENHRGPGVL